MNCLLNRKDVIGLLDLPDEIILIIMEKVHPQVLLLSSMMGVGNNRLEKLALNRSHSIDISVDYHLPMVYRPLMDRFYSDIMPRISDHIQSLTIHLQHISFIQTFAENNCNGTFPNLTHFKILFSTTRSETKIPYTLGNCRLHCRFWRYPLNTVILQSFIIPTCKTTERIATLCRSSFMRSIQSFELDDSFCLADFTHSPPRFDQVPRLTHIRISLCHFEECLRLLNHLGSQLCSFTVTLRDLAAQPDLIGRYLLISCPNLKQMTLIIQENFNSYQTCFSLLQRLSNVESLTLLLSIGRYGATPSHFIDGFVLEENILPFMPRLRQFNFHIRSILQNASHLTTDQIRQSFRKQKQPFDCALDYFNNKHGQCQIYSLPFIGTRLDFVSNRFPLFDLNRTFSNVTTLLLFDDVEPFESIFFERVAEALPRLKTLEIINQLEQRHKTTTTIKTNFNLPHLAVLILYDIHIDYAEQFLCQIHLSSLIELAINKDVLFRIIAQNHQQARNNCSRIGTLITSEPSYQSIDTIRNFFPLAYYAKHYQERNQ